MAVRNGDPARRIDELEREVARLQGAEQFLRSIVESAPDFIVRIRPEGTVLYLNRLAPGYRPEDIVGQSVFDFIAPAYHRAARECFARVVATGLADSYEAVGPGSHGEPTPFFVRVAPIREGAVVAFLTLILTDVSAIKRAERELRESDAKLRLTLSATGMGLWSWEVTTDRLVWDARTCAIAGIDPSEAPKTPAGVLPLVHPEDAPRLRDVLRDARVGRGAFSMEYRYVLRDGSVRWVISTGTIMRDDLAGTTTVLGGTLDVTARHTMDEQLRQTQKLEAVGQLTAGVAHNFNNMLAVILPLLDIAAESAPPDLTPLLEAAHASAERAADLVKQLMLFAGGRSRGPAGSAVVTDVLHRIVGICRTTFDPRIEVALEVAPELPRVAIDSGQLEQCVLNVLLNARDAVARATEPRIHVAVDVVPSDAPALRSLPKRRPVDHVRLRIRDNGHGMDEATRRRVFEPFFTTKPIGQGTGLGLSSTFGMVRDANGAIECESVPGVGTTFAILLPSRTGESEPCPPPRPPSRGGTEHVLLVEDDGGVRLVVTRILRSAGYRVSTAGDGEEALERIRAPGARYDLVILDASLPRTPGSVVLREILVHDPRAKVIGFTGDSAPMSGARTTLPKPADGATLLATVRAVLDEP